MKPFCRAVGSMLLAATFVAVFALAPAQAQPESPAAVRPTVAIVKSALVKTWDLRSRERNAFGVAVGNVEADGLRREEAPVYGLRSRSRGQRHCFFRVAGHVGGARG